MESRSPNLRSCHLHPGRRKLNPVSVGVVIEGNRELIRSLRAVHEDLPKQLGPLHKRVSEPIAEAGRSRAPRGPSGRLAESVRAGGTQRTGVVMAGRKAVPYAGPIHFGWPARNIPANPFLTDALDAKAEDTADLYTELLDAFLDSVWESIR